jgi:hypothetical protein
MTFCDCSKCYEKRKPPVYHEQSRGVILVNSRSENQRLSKDVACGGHQSQLAQEHPV